MQILIYTGLAFFCIAVLILVFVGHRGLPRAASDLKEPIIGLLRQGYNEGFLIINVGIFSNKFIQLRKYIKETNDFGIYFSFPKANWSESIFTNIVNYYELNDIKYKIEKNYLGGELDFLIVDFHKDWERAIIFWEKILIKTFNLNPEDKVYVCLENASDEPINEI